MDGEIQMLLRCLGLMEEILSVTDWHTQRSAARVCRVFFEMVQKIPLRKVVFGDVETASYFAVSRVAKNEVMQLLASSFSPKVLSVTFRGLPGNVPQLTLPTFDSNIGQFPVETLVFDGGSIVPLNLSDVGKVFPKLKKLKVSDTSVYVIASGLSLTAFITDEIWTIGSGFWNTKAAFELIGTCIGSLPDSKKEWMTAQYNYNSGLKGELLLLLSFLYPETEKDSWNVERVLELPAWQLQLLYSGMMEAAVDGTLAESDDDDDEFPFEV